jgi:hypothetical protein
MEQQQITIISKNPVRKVNKNFFLWSYIGGWIALFLISMPIIVAFMGIVAASSESSFDFNDVIGPVVTLAGFFIIGFALLVYITVISCILLFKAWKAIEDGHQRTTAGKAVGFLFIPLFNLYWIFQAYWGFAKDYNLYLARYQLNTGKLSEGLFLARAIVQVAGIIPGLNYVTPIVSTVLQGLIINSLCDGINRLAV